MKNQRLDNQLLADSLKDRQLVDPEALLHILHQCNSTGALFTELLVREGLIADWELGRVCCDVFGLPFLPLESYEPNRALADELDPGFLRQYCIVPLDRFGKLVTVAMPAIVPGEVLAQIEAKLNARVLPVIGSVQANLRWLEEHLPQPQLLAANMGELEASDWTNVLDLGEEAVKDTIEQEAARPRLELREEELESTLQMFDLEEEPIAMRSTLDDLELSQPYAFRPSVGESIEIQDDEQAA